MTREEIEKGLNKIASNIPTWKHHIWEENGEKFSAWTLKSDRMTITTGDSGKAEFDKVLQEEFKKFINDPKLYQEGDIKRSE